MAVVWAPMSDDCRMREGYPLPAGLRRHAPLRAAAAVAFLAALTACTETTTLQLDFAVDSTRFNDCRAGGRVLHFYVSDLHATDARNTRVPVELDGSRPSQDARTALVSLPGECASTAGHTRNATVTGRLPRGDYRHLEFDLGVPFARNHAHPLRAQPPLNLPSMFWTWQTGYKFVRLDLGDRWSLHLGSTGCASASAARPPAQPCRRPNLARVRLPMPPSPRASITVDLDALLEGVDPSRHPSCTDRYAERPACASVLAALGLDPVTGACAAGCTGQTAFRVSHGAR